MKTFLKRLLNIFLALVGFLVLFHLVEDWRGARAKNNWLKASISAGMPQTLEEMAPPKIPDAENFATHPSIADAIAGRPEKGGPVLPTVLSDGEIYRAWEEGKQIDLGALKASLKVADLGTLLSPFTVQLQGLEEASLRPHCRLMPTYGENVPALLGMRQRARVLSLRAVISLRDGKSEAAMGDILTILRVVKHLKQEPHLLSQLLRIASVKLAFQPIWEGLHAHQWNEQQLSRLQAALGDINLLESWRRSWIAESIYDRGHMQKVSGLPLWPSPPIFNELELRNGRVANFFSAVFLPKGWIYQNLIRVAHYHQEQFIDVIDPSHHFLNAGASDQVARSWKQTPRNPYTMLAKLYPGDLTVLNMRMGHAQSTTDQAFIACALERYFLAHRTYPERLEDLVPTNAVRTPVDIIDGKPLHYRKETKNSYLLYSIGWNGTDEGGKAAIDFKQQLHHLLEKGDWVWMSPRN